MAGPTRVPSDQLEFRSSINGTTNLDTYLEAAEIGGRPLAAPLGDIFDNSGIFVAAGLYDWKGTWTTSTAYTNGDTFEDPANGNIYVTLVSHTSTSIATDVSANDIALVVDVSAVATSATAAATSATNAATSKTNAATSATNAATSETNAATSASGASTSASGASTSATAAATSTTAATAAKVAAQAAQSAAETAETNSASSATGAAASATGATTSATTATNAATGAATSATNAATSTTAASSSAAGAATSATNAATSATNAATAETNAETAETSAETAEANAQASSDRFILPTASAPTVRDGGSALQAGDVYLNTGNDTVFKYSGSLWVASAINASLYVALTGGTMTGPLNVTTTDSITAGTTQTQAGATALTAEINRVTVVATNGDSVALPTAVSGKTCTIINADAAQSLQVWPGATFSDTIDGGAANAVDANSLAFGESRTYKAVGTTNWSTISDSAVVSYIHPNHSGDVTSTADGAQVIAPGVVTLAMLAAGTDGELITWSAAGAAAAVAVGTSGQVLTSGGAGVAPTFVTTVSAAPTQASYMAAGAI